MVNLGWKLQRGTNILTLDCNNQKLRFRLTRSWSLGLQWPHGYLVPFTDLFLPVLITNLVQVFPRKTDGIRECGSIDRRSAVPCGRDPARASTRQFSEILNWVTFFNRKYVHTYSCSTKSKIILSVFAIYSKYWSPSYALSCQCSRFIPNTEALVLQCFENLFQILSPSSSLFGGGCGCGCGVRRVRFCAQLTGESYYSTSWYMCSVLKKVLEYRYPQYPSSGIRF